jgi:hypothetical protein
MFKKIALLATPLLSLALIAYPATVYAIPTIGPVSGLPSGVDVAGTILGIIATILGLIAIVAVIVIIIAGIMYIFSFGDEDATRRARNTVVYAVVGLIVIGISIVVVNFVIDAINAT